MNNPTPINATATAVRNALNRAKAHAGTAALAAVLSPLAIAPAEASNVTSTTSTTGGVTTFTYHVSNINFDALYAFELPEVDAGDFDLNSFVGPDGWSVSSSSTAAYDTTSFKIDGPTPGEYLLFSTRTSGIVEGLADFSLNTTRTGVIDANFTVQTGLDNHDGGYNSDGTQVIDPQVPNGANAAAIPEPPITALLLGGLTAAAPTARRRRA